MKKSKLKLLIIPALVAMTGITAESVYSLGSKSPKVKYGQDTWNTQTEFNKKWYSNIKINEKKLTFELDLSDYISDEDVNINEILSKSAKLKKVDGTVSALNIKISPMVGQVGKYNVLVDLIAGQDKEEIIVNLNIKENNTVGLPVKNIEFKVIRDVTNPKIIINGVEDGKVYNKNINFNVEVKDSTAIKATTEVKQSGKVIDKNLEFEDNKGTLKLVEDGNYEIKVLIEDKAGNKSEKTTGFKINRQGPKIETSTDSKYINEANKKLAILIKDINGIDITKSNVKFKGTKKQHTEKFDSNGKLEVDLSAYGNGPIDIVITAIDSLGKVSTKKIDVVYDSIAPYFNVNTNTGGFVENKVYKDKFDLKFVSSDINFKDFKVLAATIDGVKTDLVLEDVGAKQKKIFINKDGVYNILIEATDLAGNKIRKTLKFGLDTKAPDITTNEELKNQFFTTNKNIIFKVEEQHLKDDITISAKKYQNDTEENEEIYEIKEKFVKDKNTYSLAHNFTENGRYEVNIVAKDVNGRTTSKTFKFKIDKEAPKVNIITDMKNNGYYSENKTIDCDVTDNYAIAEGGVIGDKPVMQYECSNHDDHRKVSLRNEKTYSSNGKYEYFVIMSDLAGNETRKELTFTIDKCAPEIEVTSGGESSKVENNMYLNKNSVKTTIKESNLHGFEYKLKDGAGKVIKPKITTVNAYTKSIIAPNLKDGKYKLDIKASDKIVVNNDNRESKKSLNLTVDTTAPEVEILGVKDKGIYNNDKTLKVKLKDLNWKSGTIKISKDGKMVEEKKLNNDETSIFNLNEDGNYNVNLNAIDLASNKVNKVVEFVIDKSKPIVIIENFENSNVKYFKELKSLKGQINEDNFNLKSFNITAKKVKVDGTETIENLKCDSIDTSKLGVIKFEIASKYFKEGRFFDENAKYSVNIEEVDLAGNKTNKNINFVIDNVAPKVEIKGLDLDAKNKHYNTNVAIDININELYHDVNKVEVLKDGKPYEIGNLKESDKNLKLLLDEEGQYVLNINATDRSKNTVSKSINFVIDKTPTNLQIINKDKVDGMYFSENQNISIMVEDKHFNHANFNLKVEHEQQNPDGSVRKAVLPFNMNRNKVTKTFKFEEEAKHTLTLSARDGAGNISKTEKVSFVIDKVAPKIDISGVEDGQHYNETKNIDIEIFDNNHEKNDITVTKNGRAYNLGKINVQGNKAYFSHAFEGEGDYNINVSSMDKSGRKAIKNIKFTIDKTVPVIVGKVGGSDRIIAEGDFINKVFKPTFTATEINDKIDSITINGESYSAGNAPILSEEIKYNCIVKASDKAGNKSEKSFSFTIDTTVPKVDITGIISGFFNKEIAPKYILEDKNLDKKNSSAMLNGKNFISGTKLKKDDYYNLKVKGQDLAKNINEKSISFVLDRGEPTIIFDQALSGEYFTEDFIPNFIIEDLTDYQIVSMLLNGENYEMGEMITTEGKNVLFIEVKDKAGNLKSLTVEFILDKTAPKFIINGIEDEEKYNGPVEATIKLKDPSDKIKSVLVNGKPAEGDIKEVNGEEVMKINFKEIDDYKVELEAVDLAGNKTKETIDFEIESKELLVKKKNGLPMLLIILGIVMVAGTGIYIARKKKEN